MTSHLNLRISMQHPHLSKFTEFKIICKILILDKFLLSELENNNVEQFLISIISIQDFALHIEYLMFYKCIINPNWRPELIVAVVLRNCRIS